MALEQESFSYKLWMSVRKEAIYLAYSRFVLNYLGREVDRSFNDNIYIGYFVVDENALFKAMQQSYRLAEEFIEDTDIKSRIKQLGDSFTLICPTDHLIHLGSIFDYKPLQEHAARLYSDFLSERSYMNDNPQQNAACAIIPLAVHLRVFVFLAQDIFPGLRSSLLQSFYNEYSKILAPTEDLLNELCASVNMDLVKGHYAKALLHDIRFFVAQNFTHTLPLFNHELHGSISNVELEVEKKLTIVTALGSTCISTDVKDGISELAILVAERAGQNTKIKRAWDDLVAHNSVELNNCVERMVQMQIRKGFDFTTLSEAMKQLTETESSIRLKVESLIQGGLEINCSQLMVDSLQFSYGCEKFLHDALNIGLLLYVMSHAGYEHILNAKLSAWDLKLEFPPTHVTCDSYLNAKEKYDLFKGISNTGCKSMTICIGQSLNELLCLLEADIGIVLGLDTNLRKVAETFGVRFIPLVEWIVGQEREDCMDSWGSKSGRLFLVESWCKIHGFLLGDIGISNRIVLKEHGL